MLTKSILRIGLSGLAMMQFMAAQATTLNGITGGIFVSRGAGYHAVNAPIQLSPGNSVLANPGSSAKVVFDDGCVVSVQPGMVYTVPETSPCLANVPPTVGDEMNWPLVAGAALVVGGGVAIAIAAGGGGGGGGGGPASP